VTLSGDFLKNQKKKVHCTSINIQYNQEDDSKRIDMCVNTWVSDSPYHMISRLEKLFDKPRGNEA